jgi:uncharacterized membrane protein YfcA
VSLFLFSTLVSTLGTIAGIGGGIFLVPALVMCAGAPIDVAIGVTALSLFPGSLVSSLRNFKAQMIDFKLMWALEVPAIVGAIGGSVLTAVVPERPLEIAFALFLLFVALRTFLPRTNPSPWIETLRRLNTKAPVVERTNYSFGLWATTPFGFLSGIVAGLLGIGGGIIKTPLMIHVFQVPSARATATAICTIVFTSLASGFTHYQMGHFDRTLFFACASGMVCGAFIGTQISWSLKEDGIKKIVAVSMFAAGLAILFKSALT